MNSESTYNSTEQQNNNRTVDVFVVLSAAELFLLTSRCGLRVISGFDVTGGKNIDEPTLTQNSTLREAQASLVERKLIQQDGDAWRVDGFIQMVLGVSSVAEKTLRIDKQSPDQEESYVFFAHEKREIKVMHLVTSNQEHQFAWLRNELTMLDLAVQNLDLEDGTVDIDNTSVRISKDSFDKIKRANGQETIDLDKVDSDNLLDSGLSEALKTQRYFATLTYGELLASQERTIAGFTLLKGDNSFWIFHPEKESHFMAIRSSENKIKEEIRKTFSSVITDA